MEPEAAGVESSPRTDALRSAMLLGDDGCRRKLGSSVELAERTVGLCHTDDITGELSRLANWTIERVDALQTRVTPTAMPHKRTIW